MEDDGSLWTAQDEETCLERGGEWEFSDPGDPDNTEGWCYEVGGANGGAPLGQMEDDGSIWTAPDEGTCLERGGLWEQGGGFCFEEYVMEDDGSLWTAADEETCLERGGIWESEEGWGWCYEDWVMEDRRFDLDRS